MVNSNHTKTKSIFIVFLVSILAIACKTNKKQDKTPVSHSKKYKAGEFNDPKKRAAYKAQWIFPPKDSFMLVTEEQQHELAASEETMQWYKDAKLGIFVHWGPALSVTDKLSWGREGERPGAGLPGIDRVPAEIYDVQYKKFNPVNFDADRWMKQVKEFGAKYIVFTAKHHDGFCFFDAPNTDYDIMHTPFKRDVVKELADAAHKNGVKLFWYYSQPDWTHPDCLREKHYESYLPYMNQHIEQLFTKYGKIAGVFWDGLGSKYWQWDSYHLIKKMKQWQPDLISNPRSGSGWPDGNHRGDFDTPEQSLGPVNHHRYWEACLTMTDRWLYHKNGPIKKAEAILGMLIQVAGNGGNLLLNLGPNGQGEFVAEEVTEAKKVGDWLKKYGHTLYNTRRGIYIGGDWGASTQKDNKIYLHFIQKLSDNTKAVFELPKLPVDIVSVKGITKGFKKYQVKNNKLIIEFDKAGFDKNLDNIVEITVKKPLKGMKRIKTWHAEPLTTKDFSFKASSYFAAKFKPDVIYKDRKNVFNEGIKLKNRWTPNDSDKTPTLTLEFNTPKEIKTILLSEQMLTHSVRDFDILVEYVQGNWEKIYSGNVIGEGLRIKLNGDKIYGAKLKINKSAYQTQISAFNVYE